MNSGVAVGRRWLPAEPVEQLKQVAEVHAAVAVVVEVPQVARIAGMLAERANEAEQIAQVHVSVAIAVAVPAESHMPCHETMRDRNFAIPHIPKSKYAAEAKLLADRFHSTRERRKTGPGPLREIIAIVLARLGVGVITSKSVEW